MPMLCIVIISEEDAMIDSTPFLRWYLFSDLLDIYSQSTSRPHNPRAYHISNIRPYILLLRRYSTLYSITQVPVPIYPNSQNRTINKIRFRLRFEFDFSLLCTYLQCFYFFISCSIHTFNLFSNSLFASFIAC